MALLFQLHLHRHGDAIHTTASLAIGPVQLECDHFSVFEREYEKKCNAIIGDNSAATLTQISCTINFYICLTMNAALSMKLRFL